MQGQNDVDGWWLVQGQMVARQNSWLWDGKTSHRTETAQRPVEYRLANSTMIKCAFLQCTNNVTIYFCNYYLTFLIVNNSQTGSYYWPWIGLLLASSTKAPPTPRGQKTRGGCNALTTTTNSKRVNVRVLRVVGCPVFSQYEPYKYVLCLAYLRA